ncbi:hypothetical protein BDA96_09G078500 [Sorghum bicolor]|uniref:Uncharacterized protein n=2 Tax=Sorghum bicolor TaxID=4558 RepID=A0A921U435_SORBI|nr:hypothetical protein BDA96_09G078500 [Sorghum bicolor]KXG21514.1 hypothetical protein SORBI_3009G074000 [Sorghum bicolor]
MPGGALAPSSFLNKVLFDALSSLHDSFYNSSFPKAGPTCQSNPKEVGPHGFLIPGQWYMTSLLWKMALTK